MAAASDQVDALHEPRGAEASLRGTLRLIRPASGGLALATLLGAGALAAGIGLIATSAWLISRASERPEESALAIAIVAVQFFGLSRGLFRYGQRVVGHDAAFGTLARLRVSVYKRLESLAPAGLPAFRSGDLLARVVHDVDSLQDLLLRVIPPFVIALLVGAVTVLFVWWVLPAAGATLLVSLILAATVLTWLTSKLARRSEAKQATVRAELTAAVVDLLEGAPELTAYGALGTQARRTAEIDARLTGIASAAARTTGVGQGFATLLCGLAMWSALLVGVVAVHSGRLEGVLLAVVALVPLAAFELVTDLPGATQALQRVRCSAARTFEVIDAPAPVPEPTHPVSVTTSTTRTLTIRGLHARYGDDEPWVLDGLDLDLATGRTVALLGRSGAGKSTLADVLLRFLPYQRGSITLDGIPITELCGDEYRRVVGLLSQDVHIFDTTLEENLRVARRDATPEELDRALNGARLQPWLAELPAGLSTRVGAQGEQISGGQRQRLALARALLADFPVLVVDEPGEHLDSETADALMIDLLDNSDERATLLITHRLAGLQCVDEIVVLDGGRGVERGSHAELLSVNGRYAQMWAREVSG